MAVNSIISNQVFKELQVPSFDSSESTGTIIYANSYSGRGSVDIPEPYRSILNSDFGEVGNSILVQLEQKVQGFPNGPWFIDSIDDVVYIHNRKFREGPVHHFSYQQGNGELLDIEFQTQYITKRLDGTMSAGISDDKILNTDITTTRFFGDYLVDKDAPEMEKITTLESAYADYQSRKLSYEDLMAIESMFDNQGVSLPLQAGMARLSKKRRDDALREDLRQATIASTEESYNTFKAEASKTNISEANKKFHNVAVEDLLNGSDLEREARRIVIEVTGGSRKYEEELGRKIREAAKNGKLEEFMKGYFGSSIHALDEAASNTNPNPYQVVQVDPRSFSGSPIEELEVDPNKPKDIHQINTWNTKQFHQAQKGLENLRNDPTVKVLSSFNGREDYYPGKKITVFKRVETVGIVSQYQILYKYYTRKYGSGGSGSWADVERRINEAGNQGKRTTERKLICTMTCIGNPKLASSQVVMITNVGKKWSGVWYIKSCTHKLVNGQGYTCTLQLVKNGATNAANTTSLGVGTKGVSIANMSNNGSDVVDNNIGDVMTRFTQEEITWFYGEMSKGRAEANEAAMILLLGKDSNNPWHREHGVIKKRSITSSSGTGTKHEYFVDPNLKRDVKDLQKYSAKASKLVKELEDSLKENIKK